MSLVPACCSSRLSAWYSRWCVHKELSVWVQCPTVTAHSLTSAIKHSYLFAIELAQSLLIYFIHVAGSSSMPVLKYEWDIWKDLPLNQHFPCECGPLVYETGQGQERSSRSSPCVFSNTPPHIQVLTAATLSSSRSPRQSQRALCWIWMLYVFIVRRCVDTDRALPAGPVLIDGFAAGILTSQVFLWNTVQLKDKTIIMYLLRHGILLSSASR